MLDQGPQRGDCRRARCEDRIRNAKDTGLRNLPLHGAAQNQLWLELVALAGDLTAWTQMLAFTDHPARRWEPKRLRLRVFSAAGRLVKGGRRLRLRLRPRLDLDLGRGRQHQIFFQTLNDPDKLIDVLTHIWMNSLYATEPAELG